MSATEALAAFDSVYGALKIDEQANCQWRVKKRPVGNVEPDDFEWAAVDIPEPAEGEVLLKTLYLGLVPVMRFYMQGTGAAGEKVLEPGDVIHGRGVAQIVKSRHPDWHEGEIVQGQLGWQTYKVSAMTPQEKFVRMPNNNLPAALGAGVLGMTGFSAYTGFLACGDPKQGDLMVLSGAAGGVGSIVSQIAANVIGCDVVGIAGGPAKCEFILNNSCSGAIDYKVDDIEESLDRLRPDGIDLYFDNVGGETLEACLNRLRMHARVVLCGSISEYVSGVPYKLPNYTKLRATDSNMRGFFVYNHLHRWDQAMDDMAGWIHEGKLKPVQDMAEGFQNMPRSLSGLYYGNNIGAQCCSIRGEPNEWL